VDRLAEPDSTHAIQDAAMFDTLRSFIKSVPASRPLLTAQIFSKVGRRQALKVDGYRAFR
jgi:hypothetical protein